MCPKSQNKEKNSTELFQGSAFYSIAESSRTEPHLRFCTAKKGFARKFETMKVLCKMITVQYGTIRLTYQRLMILYRILKVSYFLTKPFFLTYRILKKNLQQMVLRLSKMQHLQNILPNFLSFSCYFGNIWGLLKTKRTFR